MAVEVTRELLMTVVRVDFDVDTEIDSETVMARVDVFDDSTILVLVDVCVDCVVRVRVVVICVVVFVRTRRRQ